MEFASANAPCFFPEWVKKIRVVSSLRGITITDEVIDATEA